MSRDMIKYKQMRSKDMKPVKSADKLLKHFIDTCKHTHTIDVGDSDHIRIACIDCETIESPDKQRIDTMPISEKEYADEHLIGQVTAELIKYAKNEN